MAYIDTYNLKTGTAGAQLRARAEVALADVAIGQLTVVPAPPQEYLDLAKAILGDTAGYLERIIWPIMTNATVQAGGANTTDAQLKAAVLAAIVMFL